ncbi:ESX secretion-associated protein EspG [Amycolatopsis sp. NPDC051758]|uniref:ESX secretion-associated protein EspG n=1 Tax=Amycolatopsis sp. NPDC051758 TaxID=3363935 RepID=UPI0037A54974
MNNSVAVFDVIDEVIAPLSAEVPERPSVMEFYDPQFEIPPVLADTEPLPGRRPSPPAEQPRSLADEVEQYTRFVAGMAAIGLAPGGEVTPEAVGLYRALRGGFIRGVVTGVFPARDEPWEVRFFGDEDYTTVLHKLGNRARLRSGFLSELPGWVFDGLPDRPPGPGGLVRIETDERGLIPRGCERAVEQIRECAARPRLGTVLVDLAVRDAILAEYPHGAFGLVDNDLGRYQFSAAVGRNGRWTVTWGPASRRTAEQWIVEAVQSHA